MKFNPARVLVDFESSLKNAINGSLRLAIGSDDKILKGEALGLLDALTLFKEAWKHELEREKE